MTRYLITGGAGFIGSNFIHYLLNKYKDCSIINLDLLTYAGNKENLKDIKDNPTYRFKHGDICKSKLVSKLMSKVEIVVNFAAESHVDRSNVEADSCVTTNFLGTYGLLKAATKHDIKQFIQISTDEVYGEIRKGSADENRRLNPRNHYAATKAAADHLLNSFYHISELPIKIIRSSNNFGPYQYPEKIISFFTTNAIDNRPLPLYDDGKQIREWIYVEDNCSAIDLIINKGKKGEIYNVGTEYLMENIELANKILKILGKPASLIEHIKDRPGHDRRYRLDSTKIQQLGWEPKEEFVQALEKTVKWYQDNQAWWRKIRKTKKFKEHIKNNYKNDYEKYL